MTAARRIQARVTELIGERVPFVLATVVRAEMPTSAQPGDAAVILDDGTVEGFVGGQCAEGSVQVAAGRVLTSGEALLLRILPEGDNPFPDRPGAEAVVNPCLSGGAIEVFLEPKLPAPELCVVGSTPIAEAIVSLGTQLGYLMTHEANGVPDVSGALAVLISSHGRHEEDTITAALDAEVGFIGLVASSVRGQAVIDSLDLNSDAKQAIHSPVGVDIGARTAEEVALSVLAEVTKAVRVDGLEAPKKAAGCCDGSGAEVATATEAIDPICSMTVRITDDTPHLHHDGQDYWYCNPGCRVRHQEELQNA